MRYGFASILAVFVLPLLIVAACATTQTLPSRAAFSEQILEPLANKKTDERLQQEKAAATHAIAKWKKEHPQGGSGFLAALGGVLGLLTGGPHGAAIGGSLGQVLESAPRDDPDAALTESLAWLDTRRAPLKGKYLALYESRIQEQNGGEVFAVCVSGKEWRYARQPGFPRLDDGPGPCPTTTISLADGAATKTSQGDNDALVNQGRAIFNGKGVCSGCHGKDGDPSTVTNPKVRQLNPSPTDLRNSRALRFVTDAERFSVLKNGIPGTGMVPMIGQSINEDEAWAVIAYLNRLQGK